MIEPTMLKLNDAAEFVSQRLKLHLKPKPTVAIVLGSGLGDFAEDIKHRSGSQAVSFIDIPHFGKSTVDGHKGELIYGTIGEQTPILIINGRLHFYEGYDAHNVVFPIRTAHLLGINTLILTNASGALADNFEPGELMVVSDHLNLTGNSPLVGRNLAELGPRFVDMSESYDKELIMLAKKAALRAGITMHEGVYAGLLGPAYETPAEIRMLKLLGADAVGMSTVFETIAARHMGLRVLAISSLTNKAAGLSPKKITHEEVMEINAGVSGKLAVILTELITQIG